MNGLLIKERALKYGTKVLLPLEKLQLITAIDEQQLSNYKSLIDIRKRSEELQITQLQELKVKALFDLIEHYAEEKSKGKRLTSPKDIHEYMKAKVAHLQVEKFYTILLDTKMKVIDTVEISQGSLTGSIVHPREVFKSAIQQSSYAMICVHNHPSGNTEPSNEDVTITKRLKEVGQIIGIQVLDHVIIGIGEYTSLKDQGCL